MKASSHPDTDPGASYAGLPDDPADALQWLVGLPDTFDFAGLQPVLHQRIELGNSPLWTVVMGFVKWRLKDPAVALECYQQVLPQMEANATFQLLRGMAARKLPEMNSIAEAAYERALELDPLRSDAHYNLGNLYRDDRPLDAERCYRASLSLNPDQPMCWHNYAILLIHELRIPEALNALHTSLRLDPDVASVWCNLSLAKFAERRIEPARRTLYRAISLEPALSHATPDQAITFWEQGGKLTADTIDALWDFALISLASGDYRNGWRYYEVRFSTKNFVSSEVPTVGPRLSSLVDAPRPGEPELVVWSEQGLGDAIQFGRYLPLLDAAGIPYEVRCRKPLLNLFRDWFGFGERAVLETHRTDSHDHRPHVSLLSLPHLFGSDLCTLPSVAPYLHPPCVTPEHLQVAAPPGGLSVGLVWAANPENKAMYRHKSLPVRLLMPRLLDLLDMDLIDLHSLQFGTDRDQLDPFRSHERITDWSEVIDDFADTAHVISQLDLVITVDTAVAHLAAALDRPTWLLLPRNSDFRWLSDRSDSPWYPRCLRLFRQPDHGDWDTVIDALHTAIDDLFLLDFTALKAGRMVSQA